MNLDLRSISLWLWGGMWLLLVSAALIFRPILPVDETRYLSVAWEMWLSKDYLVPHLNGSAYSHKPPLLFWLMNIGWNILGVNEWWPRLVAPTCGLGCIYLTASLGKKLWQNSNAYLIAPFVLLGTFFWSVYTTLTMFDLLVCLWTLFGIHGLLDSLNGRLVRGWLIFAIAVGMGILSKGPVILVYLLPMALFAIYWFTGDVDWIRWYTGTIIATLCGVGLALSWALPAGLSGGQDYQNAIFWGQSAGRVLSSFSHAKPFWWYLAVLPGLIMPWLLWPTLWRTLLRGARSSRGINHKIPASSNTGIRLITIWVIATIVILSAISGKRPHYLLPMFPALALFVSYIIATHADGRLIPGRLDLLPFALISLIFAITFLFAPEIGKAIGKSEWAPPSTRICSGPPFLIALILIWYPPKYIFRRIVSITMASILLVVVIHAAISPALTRAYDLKFVATFISNQQKKGVKIANFGKYHGQYNFLGRLTEPLSVTGQGEVVEWLKLHPEAKIISYYDRLETQDNPELIHPFRSKVIAVWDRATILAHPLVATRNSNGQRLLQNNE